MNLATRASALEDANAARGLAWAMMAKSVAALNYSDPVELAEAAGAPREARQFLKAAIGATSSEDTAQTTRAPSASAFVRTLSGMSGFARLVASGAFRPAAFETVHYSPTAALNGAVVGEGQPIPVSPLSFTRHAIPREAIGALIVTTAEAMRDLSAEGAAYIEGLLREAAAKALDATLLDRLTTTGTLELTAAFSDDDIAANLALLLEQTHNRVESAVVFMASPQAISRIAPVDIVNTDVFAGRLLGRPLVPSPALTNREVVAIDGGKVGGLVGGVQVRASNSATLEMESEPTGDAITPTPTTQTSLFQTNSMAAKTVVEFGLLELIPGSLAKLTIQDPA